MRWRYLLASDRAPDAASDDILQSLDAIDLTARLVTDSTAHLVLNRQTQRHIKAWFADSPAPGQGA